MLGAALAGGSRAYMPFPERHSPPPPKSLTIAAIGNTFEKSDIKIHVGDVVCRSHDPELVFPGPAVENEIISYLREEPRRILLSKYKVPLPHQLVGEGWAYQAPKSSRRTL